MSGQAQAETGVAGGAERDLVPARSRGITRRVVLTGAGRIALTAGLGPAMLAACAPPIGEPWSDQTFWDDGTGWIE